MSLRVALGKEYFSKMIIFITVFQTFGTVQVYASDHNTYKSNVVLLSITSFSYDFISLEATANPL